MFRSTPFVAALFAALGAPLGAQTGAHDPKQPFTPPLMEDVKTAPVPLEREASAARNPVQVDAANVTRPPRSPAAAGFTRREPTWPLYDVDESGTHWVRGRTYKASFGTEGATYIPFLGSDAPRNFPVTMRLAAVTVGDGLVAYDSEAPAARSGDAIELDRGAFVERYDIGRDGIEQSFHFRTLPARGELVVVLDVESELAGRADGGGLRFENALGHVRYGRAVAFDAAGRRVDVESRLESGRIRLVAPADFVAQAELPLVIDPFISTFAVDIDAGNDWNPDVAFATGSSPAALVVYENDFSASDHDVYGEKYVDQIYQGLAVIDFTGVDWRNPRVAGNALSNQFLCVAEAGVSPTRIIRGRTVSSSSLAMSAQFTINGSESGDKHEPDVGGDPLLLGPTYYCVVWQRDYSSTDTDIHARLVTTSATLVGSSTILLENSAATLDSLPSISKTDGNGPASGQDWSIVWQHDNGTDLDVQGARIHWNGAITSSTFGVAATSENERFPTASEPLDDHGLPRQWLAVYRMGNDLRFRAFQGTGVVATMDRVAGSFQSFSQPDATSDGRLWQVCFTSTFGLFPNYDTDVLAATVSTAGGSFSYAEVATNVAATAEDETRPHICSTLGDGNPYRSYVAYDTTTPSSEHDVLVGVYDSPVNAGVYSYCYGDAAACPCSNGGAAGHGCASSVNANGALLGTAGPFFVSYDYATLTASGMPSTATGLFFQGTSAILNGSPFGDGLRCASGTIIRLGTKTASGGSSTYPGTGDASISVRGLVPDAGGWRYYQTWYRNSAAFCTSSTFNLTNGVAILWAP